MSTPENFFWKRKKIGEIYGIDSTETCKDLAFRLPPGDRMVLVSD